MKTRTPRSLFCLLAFLAFAIAAGAADFFIKSGDRVVFLGDSITEQRLYTTYIEGYALTRYPDWQLTFRNVGWGGDTAWLRQRAHPDEKQLFAADDAAQQAIVEEAVKKGLERDVLPLKPTAVTIKFGMNDHAYQAFRPDIFRAYVKSQTELAKILENAGARVAFLTSQPIEDKRADPDKDIRNQSLRKFSDGLREVAAKEHALFVDQFDPYMAILLRERAGNPPAMVGGGDAVHPGPIGHTVMAWAVLKGLGASAVVSRAAIDASAKTVSATEACRIENLKVEDGSLTFDRLDQALPMPIDPKAEPALKLAPILQDLSRYELKVTGLPAGNYTIAIDGSEATKVSADQLAAGYNLSLVAGPITEQARSVLSLVFKKNDVFFGRWRGIQLYQLPEWARGANIETQRAAEIVRLDAQIAELEGQINAARKPKSHQFIIKKAE